MIVFQLTGRRHGGIPLRFKKFIHLRGIPPWRPPYPRAFTPHEYEWAVWLSPGIVAVVPGPTGKPFPSECRLFLNSETASASGQRTIRPAFKEPLTPGQTFSRLPAAIVYARPDSVRSAQAVTAALLSGLTASSLAPESARRSLLRHPCRGGGKSGLHRARCQVTPGGREPTESAAESIPPGDPPSGGSPGKGEMVR